MRIFKCNKCGNIITILKEGTCIPFCCDEEMKELKANSVDAAAEKHVPVVSQDNDVVTVTCGEVLHPMEEAHYIEFMILETDNGYQIKYLNPGDEPVCRFRIDSSDEIKAAYAYCNLHGLWIGYNK